MELILASNSPRRKEILTKFGYTFSIIKSNFNEIKSGDARETARQNAEGKAKSVYIKLYNPNEYVVLGADTIVYFDGKILGKPKDEEDAVKMLKALSGKTHEVITGYSIINGQNIKSGFVVSKVSFNYLSENLIYDYVKSGAPLDKAGAYGIQDKYKLVKSYDGSLYNVMGLPIEEISPILDKLLNKTDK